MTKTNQNKQSRRRILIVSPNQADVDSLRKQLGSEDYCFERVEECTDAVGKMGEDEPDLIMMDITGDGEKGQRLCQEIRSHADTEAVPVVGIVEDEEEISESLMQMGADAFIARPFSRALLRSRVSTLLRMKEWHEKVSEQNRQLLEVNARLDALNQELLGRNRELEQGMEMARRLQDAMLPQKYPRVTNVGFSHMYSPAEAVGGDSFHITGLEDGRAAIFLADVSGHGIRAALVTSIVRAVIDYIDLNGKRPTDVLKDFNSRFRSVLGPMTPQIYATGVLMMVDGENRTVAIGNAGHPCPLLVSKREMTAEPIMGLDDSGPALGFLSDPDYPTFERKLDPGDIVLTFTDGVYEVLSEEGELFGLERLEALVEANAHLIPRDLIQKIITETENFMAASRRTDDVCVVAVEVQ